MHITSSKHVMGRQNLRLTEPAREIVQSVINKSIVRKAWEVLDELQTRLQDMEDMESLPPLRAIESEDGSLLLEWIFPHFRIGFSIEPEQEESGWYLVSDASAGNVQASGYLAGVSLEQLISWLLSYATANYRLLDGFS